MRCVYSFFIIVLCALAFVSCNKGDKNIVQEPFVDILQVKDSGEMGTQSFTGKTKSAEEVNLAFRVSGQIQKILVKEGDYVKAGQVVAIMDNRDYQVQVSATQAEYQQVKADAERIMALYEEGNTTASNYDKARYGLEQITQKLANHRNQLADTQLRSTISGYVQTKLHESGETVSAGMPVLSVFSNNDTEVEIKFSASDFANMEKYGTFYCKFDVTGDEQFPLVISRTSQEANSSQLYTVRLKFTDGLDHKKITPGMTTMVYAEATSAEATGLVDVPSTAVFQDKGTHIYIYDAKTSIVSLRPVVVKNINRDGTYTVEGLKSGEQIVISGVHHIKDGQKVRKMDKPSSSNVGGLL